MSIIGNITQFTAGSSILLIPTVSGDSGSYRIENMTTVDNPKIYTLQYAIPSSPIGKELHDILFADPEFVKSYEKYSAIIDSDLDDQYLKGKINPIKYFRMKNKMTQYELAKQIGVKQPHICRWEKKRSLGGIPAETISKIAKTLSVSTEEIIHGHQVV